MLIDLKGQKFGRLTVLEFAGILKRKEQQYSMWKCKCECGNICVLRRGSIC